MIPQIYKKKKMNASYYMAQTSNVNLEMFIF